MTVYKTFETTVSREKLEQNLERADYEQNIRRLSVFLESNPSNPHAFHNRAIAFYNLGQIEAALEDFERATNCDLQNFKSHYLRAEIFKKSGDSEKVIAALTEAVVSAMLKGDSYWIWEALRKRAAAYIEDNQPHKAVEDLNKAIEKCRSLRRGYLERGKILYEIGEREKAIEDLKNASIFGEDQDWFSVLDIILAEPELQNSGFISLFLTARDFVQKAGMPVSGKNLSGEEQKQAMRENRLMMVGTFRSMGDAQILFYPATEEEMRHQPTDFLLFPKPVPPYLFETHWTDYETADQLFALFREFERQ